MPSPVVKWAGGKTRILAEIMELAPSTFRSYVEPFAGGAALFLGLELGGVLSDVNADLIATYRAIAHAPDSVIETLAELDAERRARPNHYYEIRARWNEGPGDRFLDVRAAEFLYLNRCCYNGLWRVNADGHFNTPRGSYADPLAPLPALIRAAAPAFARATLLAGDYRKALELAGADDFVYLDPPYDAIDDFGGGASFTAYTAAKFGPAEQTTLAAECRALTARGVWWIQSNADTPRIRQLYAGHRLEPIKVGRQIGGKGAARAAVGELLICNSTLLDF